jgi:hypothetical protein
MSAVYDLKRRISEETVKGFKSVGNHDVNLKLLLEAEKLMCVPEKPVFCMASYLVFWDWVRFVYSVPDLILL